MNKIYTMLQSFPLLWFSVHSAFAAGTMPGGGVGESAGAGSPFTNYDEGIVVYTLLTAGIVFIILGGAFLIVNLGLMSKRPEDQTGSRNPSDLGILKTQVWPTVPVVKNALPAEEDDFEGNQVIASGEQKRAA